jgi:hypothetical protein
VFDLMRKAVCSTFLEGFKSPVFVKAEIAHGCVGLVKINQATQINDGVSTTIMPSKNACKIVIALPPV